MPPQTPFIVVVGSYEKLLYGLSGHYAEEGGESLPGPTSSSQRLTLKPIFIFAAHHSCIKSVSASPRGAKWLATGSTDEVIKVWDLRRRKEVGGLVQHEGLSAVANDVFATWSDSFSRRICHAAAISVAIAPRLMF